LTAAKPRADLKAILPGCGRGCLCAQGKTEAEAGLPVSLEVVARHFLRRAAGSSLASFSCTTLAFFLI
jgi:hypothetical protein